MMNPIGYLSDLKGVKKGKKLPCVFIKKASDLKKIFEAGNAATSSGRKGAINIWIDDKGIMRGSFVKFLIILESKRFKTIQKAEEQTAIWIKRIEIDS